MAKELDTTPSSVNNYFRHARQRLAETLETQVRRQVQRYSTPEASEQEFQDEWQRLGSYLTGHGGLEEAVRRPMNSWTLSRPGRTSRPVSRRPRNASPEP